MKKFLWNLERDRIHQEFLLKTSALHIQYTGIVIIILWKIELWNDFILSRGL